MSAGSGPAPDLSCSQELRLLCIASAHAASCSGNRLKAQRLSGAHASDKRKNRLTYNLFLCGSTTMIGAQLSDEDFETLSDWLGRRGKGITDIVELEGFRTVIVTAPGARAAGPPKAASAFRHQRPYRA